MARFLREWWSARSRAKQLNHQGHYKMNFFSMDVEVSGFEIDCISLAETGLEIPNRNECLSDVVADEDYERQLHMCSRGQGHTLGNDNLGFGATQSAWPNDLLP